MTDDKLSFLDDEPVAEPEVKDEPVAEEPAPEPEPEVEAQETGENEPEVPPTPEEPTEQQKVGLTALLDEREKRQAAQRKLEETERRLQELEHQQQEKQRAQEVTPPDPYAEPDKYYQHMQEQQAQAAWNAELNRSKYRVSKQYDADTVNAAEAAFAQAAQMNPSIYAEMQAHPEPYDYVMDWHKRQTFLSEVGNDLDGWKERERERIRQELLGSQDAPSSTPSKPLPPSMARAGTVGNEPNPPESGFNRLFG